MEASGLPPQGPTQGPDVPAAEPTPVTPPESTSEPTQIHVPDAGIPPGSRASETMTPDQAQELGAGFAAMRAEIAALRDELHKSNVSVAAIPVPTETAADRQAARDAAIAKASYYCPGCGNLGNYAQACNGLPGVGGHPPIEMVPTDELSGDPANYTKAPASV